MSSDTDFSSSSSEEEEHKRNKSAKKRKHKSDKKKLSKKQKKKSKKHSKHENETVQTKIIGNERDSVENNESLFGPPLPPHLLRQQEVAPRVIGPTIPKEFLINKTEEQLVENAAQSDEDDNFVYGPALPANKGMTAAQIELEQRALELKMAAIDGKNLQAVDTKEREEWMLELPKVGLPTGLAALSNLKRTFHQGKERPDFSDRSDWTKTPQDAIDSKSSRDKKEKAAAVAQEKEAQDFYVRKRDEEQERLAKNHKKKHKSDESLVEIHRKKLRKEQKKKEKEMARNGEQPERRPFTRDVDLKLNKIDSHQTKQIVDKAKILHSKFSSGHAKYL